MTAQNNSRDNIATFIVLLVSVQRCLHKSRLPLTDSRDAVLPSTVLYTDIDGQFGTLDDDRHHFTTLTVHLS